MIEQLRTELSALAEKLQRQKKIEAMLQSLFNEQRELNRREQELKYVLLKEEADVNRLERTPACFPCWVKRKRN
jgi:predicted component of type VI protein secretion system